MGEKRIFIIREPSREGMNFMKRQDGHRHYDYAMIGCKKRVIESHDHDSIYFYMQTSVHSTRSSFVYLQKMAKKGLVLGSTSPEPEPDRTEPEPMVRF